MPITFVSDCSIQTEAKEREHCAKHKQATYNFYRWCHDQFNKNTDGEYLEEMKAFKLIDLTPNKQGYTPERHPTKNKKLGKQN